MLELLWGETPLARRLADSLNIPEEDVFNLNGLFELNYEPIKDPGHAYIQEWLCAHEGLWDRWPAELERLPPRDLDGKFYRI